MYAENRQFISEGREKCLKISKFAFMNPIDVVFMFFKSWNKRDRKNWSRAENWG